MALGAALNSQMDKYISFLDLIDFIKIAGYWQRKFLFCNCNGLCLLAGLFNFPHLYS